MKLLHSPSIRKVVGIAVLLFILELNMIALYTYTMVDHPHSDETQSKPKDSIVRVKRIVNVVTGLLPGSDSQSEPLIDSGSGDGSPVPGEKVKPNFNITKKPLKKPHRPANQKPKSRGAAAKPHPKARPTSIFPSQLPPVLVVGVKCSGVSILTQLMKLHPQIVLTNGTYQGIMSNTYNDNSKVSKRRGQVVVDVSTDLYTNKDAPSLLQKHLPKLKIIVIYRDPLDRCLSCYHRAYAQLDGSGSRSFDDFVLNSKGKVNMQSELVVESTYDVYLSHWLSYFSKAQWLFVDHSQIINQPCRTLKRLEVFLGLRSFYRKDHFVFNKQQSLCLIDKLNDKLKLTSPFCLQYNITVNEASIMSPDTEDILKEYFLPHMEKTLSLISSQAYLSDLVSFMN